jgi:DNA polymerase-3 subunit alpha (Gram-positive type)
LESSLKRIGEVFSDYKAEGNISSAIVQAAVLKKKSKILEIKINSDKYIDVKEIEGLKKFIRKRFSLNDSEVTVEYAEGTDKKPIEKELKDIVLSMSDKHPILKAVIKDTEFEVKNNIINFNFRIMVSDLLIAKGLDKKIGNAIKKLYGATYKINFVDNVSSEELKRLQEETREKDIQLAKEEAKAIPGNNAPSQPKEAPPVKQDKNTENDEKKENTPLILGRNDKIKEPVIKITDITPMREGWQ